jgi:hypothetical protein
MTIKFSRSRPASGASKQSSMSFGAGLIGLALAVGGAAGCPGSLDESVITFDGSRPPPPPSGMGGAGGGIVPPPPAVAGAGGRGGARGMAGSSGRRPPDAAVAAAGNCWEPAEITNRILLPKCAGAACHDSVMPAGMLDLQAAGARMRLQNIPSKLCAEGGTARPLVTVQGNNVTGHFFDKLTGQHPAACGQRMPRNGMMAGYLNATEVQCLKDWFTRNAPARMPDAGVAPAPPPPPVNARPQPPAGFCANPAVDGFEKVLQPLCGAQCHNPGNPALFSAFLDLYNPGAKARLEGVASRQCAGKTLINRGRPDGFLFDKVQNQVPLGCGAPMPPNIPFLHPAEIKCLQDWIAPGVAQ